MARAAEPWWPVALALLAGVALGSAVLMLLVMAADVLGVW